LHASDAKYCIGAALLLAVSMIVALMLVRETPQPDKAEHPKSPAPAVEQPRPLSPPQQAPVQSTADELAAERERERRRAAARRKAAEKALDLR
jgi:hypothetical protein